MMIVIAVKFKEQNERIKKESKIPLEKAHVSG